VVSLTIALRL